jgi:hypothetical protein
MATMGTMNLPEPAPFSGSNTRQNTGLYGVVVAGSMMFDRPTTRNTFRIVSAAVQWVSPCAVLACYLAHRGHLRRFSGKADPRLDLLVDAATPQDGPVDSSDGDWLYALFLREGTTLRGCLVLHAKDEPSSDEQSFLRALARPTAAALATAEAIQRDRRRARELRRLTEAQSTTNRAMAETIRHLSTLQRLRDSLASAAADGETAIVQALHLLTDCPVLLQDSFGKERASAGLRHETTPSHKLVPDDSVAEAAQATMQWRTSSIHSNGELLGLVGVFDAENTLSGDERIAIDYASKLLSVELMHRRRLAEIQLGPGRDLADDLLTGADPVGARNRAESLHYDLSQPQRVLVVSWALPTTECVHLDAALRHELATMHASALVSQRPNSAVAVVADNHDWTGLYDQLSAAVGSPNGTVGIGGRCAAEDLPTSFAEARAALRIRVESRQPYGTTNHDNLGLFRILDSSDGGAEVERYVEEWLGPLLQHDRLHHSELVHTLSIHLDSGGNYDDTAAALTIHRSTLRYRLARIRELSVRDLSDPDVRLNLHIATRAWAARHGGPL